MVFVDGHLLPEGAVHISALDRGFTLGDSVSETIRVHRGRPFRLAAHLARLRHSGGAIGLAIPSTDAQLAAAINATLRDGDSAVLDAMSDWGSAGEAAAPGRQSEAIVQVIVSRGIAQAESLLPVTDAPTTVIRAYPFAAPPLERYLHGARAIVSRIRRNETSPTSMIPSGSGLDAVLARVEADRQGADEAIFLNTQGHVACATGANLFWVREGTLCTPAVTCGLVAGIVREMVIEAALDGDIPARAVADPLEEMLAAEEAFLTSSTIGVMPLIRIDEQSIGSGEPGGITRQMMQAYRQALDAECQ